jgi:sugar/nucleoside kinase (ribokinase family)
MRQGEQFFDLLVLGDCNPDLILAADNLEPQFGQAERLVERAELTIGGSGSIVACGAARLGCALR